MVKMDLDRLLELNNSYNDSHNNVVTLLQYILEKGELTESDLNEKTSGCESSQPLVFCRYSLKKGSGYNEKTCFLRGIGRNSIRVRLVFMKKAVRVSILLFLVFSSLIWY